MHMSARTGIVHAHFPFSTDTSKPVAPCIGLREVLAALHVATVPGLRGNLLPLVGGALDFFPHCF